MIGVRSSYGNQTANAACRRHGVLPIVDVNPSLVGAYYKPKSRVVASCTRRASNLRRIAPAAAVAEASAKTVRLAVQP
jgi:hypothetical protein